jgi:hypothetical protein
MTAFKSYRVAHEYTQTNCAPPERVFPLLCPVREAAWVPGWQYRLIYSDSGVAELGCIFTTPSSAAPNSFQPSPRGSDSSDQTSSDSASSNPVHSETTWITTDYDPAAFRIAYVWINPGRVATELRIQLMPTEQGETQTRIRYRYTGLSPEGNREVEGYDRKWFEAKMQGWEAAINHYLCTGKRMSASDGK